MDSLLAGYGSDSSGSSSGSAAAASGKDVERERATTTATTATQTRSPKTKKPGSPAADTVVGEDAAAVASVDATDPLREETNREESPGRKRPKLPSSSVASSSAPCTSSNAADPRFSWPSTPETRNDEAADATLVHWSKDYLTPLQQRAEEAIVAAAGAASSATDASPFHSSSQSRVGGETPGLPVALTLQNSHEFTNPHQLKDAARRLNIADALGSTLRRNHDDKGSPNGADSQA
jgi:hypothetical protein